MIPVMENKDIEESVVARNNEYRASITFKHCKVFSQSVYLLWDIS